MSIKTIAISIFLKISEELSNSRLEKLFQTICEQYSVFKEEFKKEIISISRNICKDHPNKQSVLITLSRFISVSSISALSLKAQFKLKTKLLTQSSGSSTTIQNSKNKLYLISQNSLKIVNSIK